MMKTNPRCSGNQMYFPGHKTILYTEVSLKEALLNGSSVTEIAFNSNCLSFCSTRFLACHSPWYLKDSTEMEDHSPPFSIFWLKSSISELRWRLVTSAEHSQGLFGAMDKGSLLSACNTCFKVPVPLTHQAFWFCLCSPVPT